MAKIDLLEQEVGDGARGAEGVEFCRKRTFEQEDVCLARESRMRIVDRDAPYP